MWLPLATWCLANSRAPHRGTFVSINQSIVFNGICFVFIFFERFSMYFSVIFVYKLRYCVRFAFSILFYRLSVSECSSVGWITHIHAYMVYIGYTCTYMCLLGLLLLLLMVLVLYGQVVIVFFNIFFFLVLALRVYHIHIYRFLSVSVYSVFGCVCVFYLVFFLFQIQIYHFCNWWIQK